MFEMLQVREFEISLCK